MNITGKYMKAWEVEEKDGRKKINLGDGKKNQDGTWSNWTWFGCLLVGKAKDIQITKGDTVEVKSGIITMNKGKDNKYYTNITIFEIEVMTKADNGNNQGTVAKVFQDDVPF